MTLHLFGSSLKRASACLVLVSHLSFFGEGCQNPSIPFQDDYAYVQVLLDAEHTLLSSPFISELSSSFETVEEIAERTQSLDGEIATFLSIAAFSSQSNFLRRLHPFELPRRVSSEEASLYGRVFSLLEKISLRSPDMIGRVVHVLWDSIATAPSPINSLAMDSFERIAKNYPDVLDYVDLKLRSLVVLGYFNYGRRFWMLSEVIHMLGEERAISSIGSFFNGLGDYEKSNALFCLYLLGQHPKAVSLLMKIADEDSSDYIRILSYQRLFCLGVIPRDVLFSSVESVLRSTNDPRAVDAGRRILKTRSFGNSNRSRPIIREKSLLKR